MMREQSLIGETHLHDDLQWAFGHEGASEGVPDDQGTVGMRPERKPSHRDAQSCHAVSGDT